MGRRPIGPTLRRYDLKINLFYPIVGRFEAYIGPNLSFAGLGAYIPQSKIILTTRLASLVSNNNRIIRKSIIINQPSTKCRSRHLSKH